jgi:RHS repeat-associated protein
MIAQALNRNTRKFLLLVLLWLIPALSALAGTPTVTYIYTDPQGTPLAETDAQGNVTATFDYRPYGSQALGTPPKGPGYTGHVNDPETGLVYMQARYYDPLMGRFLSVDPDGPLPGDGFNFNRFAYANENPMRFSDPTGREVCGVFACETYDSGYTSADPNGSQAGGRFTVAFDGAGENLVGRDGTENGSLDEYIESLGGTVVDGGLVFSGARGRAEAAQASNWLKVHPSGHVNIFGYSRGGVAAVAMTNKLGQLGSKANSLVLFDPVAARESSLTINPGSVTSALDFFQRNPSNPLDFSGNPFNGRPASGARSIDLTGFQSRLGSVTHNNIIDVVTDKGGPFNGQIEGVQ